MIAMANEAIEDNQLATLFSCLTAYHHRLRNFKVESVPSQNHQIRERGKSEFRDLRCVLCFLCRRHGEPSGERPERLRLRLRELRVRVRAQVVYCEGLTTST